MKPATVQHTPTPWELDGNVDATWICSGDKILASVTDVSKQDAAFIVRAVNCHEDLLGALKLAERRLTDFCDRPDEQGYVVAPDSLERVYLQDIRLTVARASGETK